MNMSRTQRSVNDHLGGVAKSENRGPEPKVALVARPRTAADVPPSAWQLMALVAAAGSGWVLTRLVNLHGIANTQGFIYGATALLALGLYGSTTQISLPEVRANTRIVVLAVTVGVVAKAALITAVMYAVYREPKYLVLGLVMAQIDPLSVIALRSGSRLSERAKTILYAWASFDDPVTTLLTIYMAQLSLHILGMKGGLAGTDLGSFTLNLLANFALAVVALLVWLVFTTRVRIPKLSDGARLPRRQTLVLAGLLAAFAAVAVWQFLMLGLALVGLFFRLYLGPWLSRATWVAFLLASVALGILLAGGVALLPGLLLGAAAFGSQMVVSVILTRKLPRSDRCYLALSQQNGITAIILALLLERSFGGIAAVVAPAILVINTLHLGGTSVLACGLKKRAARLVQVQAPASGMAESSAR